MPSDVHPCALTSDQRFDEIAKIPARGYLRMQCRPGALPLSDSGVNQLEVQGERALMAPLVNEQRPMRRTKR
jgi:hypothetical protein